MKKINKVLAITLACSLFAAPSAIAAQASGAAIETQVVQYAKLDQKYVKAAEKAIEQYGNGKKFKLVEAYKDEMYMDEKNKLDIWRIQSKDRDAIITVDAVSGKVLTVSLSFEMSEVTGKYETYLKTAKAAVKELNSKSELSFEQAKYAWRDLGEDKKETIIFGTKKDRQFVEIDIKTNQPLNYSLNYKVADADQKVVDVAEQAVKTMRNAKAKPFTDIERYKYNNGEVWILKRLAEFDGKTEAHVIMTDSQGKKLIPEAEVAIDAKTGKLISATLINVNNANKKQKALTDGQATALIKPIAKQLFGVDLSTYKLKVDKDWGEYQFSSDGKESIIGKIDKFGNLVRIERDVKN